MPRVTGRCIYVTDLRKVLHDTGGVAAVAVRAAQSQFSGVWLRLARGPTLDPNFALAELPSLRSALANNGVALWGWHVPFCANEAAANDEAGKIVKWARDYELDGVLLDAEKTDESPRFRGGPREADVYAGAVHDGLQRDGCGIALSSHDQPSGHMDMPWASFLPHVDDTCPQVYYRSRDVATRLNKSIRDYKVVDGGRDFTDRYKPTGNITMSEDLPMPDVQSCLDAAKNFIDLMHANGFKGYSFWCWDTAPDKIWDFFRTTPV